MTRVLPLLLLVAGCLSGQPRDMFPWWETPLVRDLNLSEDQMRQIQAIVKENRDKLVDLRATVEKADHGVNDLMNDDKPDLTKFTAALDRQAAARMELTKVFSVMGFRIRMVLTAQQWHELQRRRMERPGMDPNRPGERKGPGGPQNRPRPQGPPEGPGPQDRPLRQNDGGQFLPLADPADGRNI